MFWCWYTSLVRTVAVEVAIEPAVPGRSRPDHSLESIHQPRCMRLHPYGC